MFRSRASAYTFNRTTAMAPATRNFGSAFGGYFPKQTSALYAAAPAATTLQSVGGFRSSSPRLDFFKMSDGEPVNGQPIPGFPVDKLAADSKAFFRPENYVPNIGATCNLPKTMDYQVAAYQYSTTCTPDLMQPAAVVKLAKNDLNGIVACVNWAHANKVAVAVRSGGHMFGGFSSTRGNNIQLDMDEFKDMKYNAEDKTFTVGAGCRLGEVDKFMEKVDSGAFCAHGMCQWVSVGGHVQSGGFSKDIGRSFGFFIDVMEKFTVVLPPSGPGTSAEVVEVTKPKNPIPLKEWSKDSPFNRNDELWYSMLGGSPGSFGVLVDCTFKPYWNADYPEARTIVRLLPYEKKAYEKLLALAQSWGSRENLPDDFNCSVAVFGGNPPTTDPRLNNMDAQMAEKYPSIYGPVFPWMPFPGMILSGTWSNLKGAGQWEKDPLPEQFFLDFDGTCDEILKDESFIHRLEAWVQDAWSKYGPEKWQLPQQPHDWKKPTKMTDAIAITGFAERNQAFPFSSSSGTGVGNMAETYPAWAADIVDDAMVNGRPKGGNLAAYVDNGTGLCGGQMLHRNCKNPVTAMPHRDTGFMVIHYIHYENVVGGKDTDEWKKYSFKNCGDWSDGIAAQCKGDRRWNMFPYQAKGYASTAADPNAIDRNMDLLKQYYFDNAPQYNRVLRAKRTIDPDDVFTPNEFGVGASRKFGTDYTEWPANIPESAPVSSWELPNSGFNPPPGTWPPKV